MQKILLSLLSILLVFSTVGCFGLFTTTTWYDPAFYYQKSIKYSDLYTPGEKYQKETTIQQQKYLKRERYLIDDNDVLDITVFDEPELSVTTRVSDEGTLSYPLIGDVRVKGLTTQEIERTLEEKLSDGYLKNPKVTVRLDIKLMKQYHEKEIFVLGEVKKPGAIPILGKYITALEAVTKASGFTDIAAPNRTRVVRVENGIEKTLKVNLNKVKRGDKFLDIILKPGDVIVVPKTYF